MHLIKATATWQVQRKSEMDSQEGYSFASTLPTLPMLNCIKLGSVAMISPHNGQAHEVIPNRHSLRVFPLLSEDVARSHGYGAQQGQQKDRRGMRRGSSLSGGLGQCNGTHLLVPLPS